MRGFLVVLVVVIAAIGLGIGVFATNLSPPAQHLPSTTTLNPAPAASYWTPIIHSGQPPSDVLGGLVVPETVQVLTYDNLDAGQGQYDRSASFFVPAAKDNVIGFYNLELPALGWKIRGAAPTRDGLGTKLLAYRFSSDSFEWQVQVSVEPTVHAGQRGSKLTVEAYQQDDDQT